MKEIDARGLACPAPVLHTKAALQEEKPGSVSVIVDNAASQQNVQRFLESQGFATSLEQTGPDYRIIGTLGAEPVDHSLESAAPEAGSSKIMVLCTTDRMGCGDDELGLKLMLSFLRTLKEHGNSIWLHFCLIGVHSLPMKTTQDPHHLRLTETVKGAG